nr:hypothetical protein [uncultured Rhodoferax sp.]
MKKYDFDDFTCTSAGRRANTLLRDHEVKPEQIFCKVLADVTQILPHLMDDAKYTTQMLFDPDIWEDWTMAEVRVAGMCLAYMVRNDVVKLFRHRRKGKAFYSTTPSTESVDSRPIRIVRLRRAARKNSNGVA